MNTGLLTIAQPHHYESEEQALALPGVNIFDLPWPYYAHTLEVVLLTKVAYNGLAVGDELDCKSLQNDPSAALAGAVSIVRRPGQVRITFPLILVCTNPGATNSLTLIASPFVVKIRAVSTPLT